jgi:hypothetical protein
MNILLDRLANRSLATQTLLLHGDLIVRESCAGVSRGPLIALRSRTRHVPQALADLREDV